MPTIRTSRIGSLAARRAKARNAIGSHDASGDGSSGYVCSVSLSRMGLRTRRRAYGARYAVASTRGDPWRHDGPDLQGSRSLDVAGSEAAVGGYAATGMPMPSFSAAIRVPWTRAAIFLNAISRA